MKTTLKRFLMPTHLMLPMVVLMLSQVLPVLGAPLVVTSSADNNGNPNTLRSVVKNAADGATIVFSDALNGSTITLLNGEIVVDKNLTIVGPADVSISIVGGNVADPLNHRIFHVKTPPNNTRTFQVSGLQMTGTFTAPNGANGTALVPGGGSGGAAMGGAIYCESSTILIVSNCYFLNCQAIGGNGGNSYSAECSEPTNGGFGGVALGGAIDADGDCYLYNSSFATNEAIGGAGGLGAQGDPGGDGGNADGGALYIGYHTDTDLKIINCTLFGNIAQAGNGGPGGSGYVCITEANPTMGGNGGHGGYAMGGGAYIDESGVPPTGMIHSTIHNNICEPGSGGVGGGGAFGGAAGSAGPPGLAEGCGILTIGASLPVAGSLFAGNHPLPVIPPVGPDVNGQVLSGGYNFVSAVDINSMGWVASDMRGILAHPLHAMLGPFQYNGGYLPTLAPERGSPVIDASFAFGITQDEIGQTRPVVAVGITVVGGDGSDMGAYEDQCSAAGCVLTVATSGNSVIIQWPSPSFCMKLQTSPDLVMWSDYVGPITIVPAATGSMNQVTINPQPANALFFRLVGL
jgi:hypothetical protein